MLCEKCSNIHFKPLKECDLYLQEPSVSARVRMSIYESGSLFYFHHNFRDALQASAEDGCHFCGMLYGHLFHLPGIHRRPHYSYPFAYDGVVLRRSIVDNWLVKPNGFQEWNDINWIYILFDNNIALTTSSLRHFEGMKSFLC